MADRVDFYVLQSQAPQRRLSFACRLTAKAYLQDLSIIVWSDSAGDAKLYDDLLWTFDDRSSCRIGSPAAATRSMRARRYTSCSSSSRSSAPIS